MSEPKCGDDLLVNKGLIKTDMYYYFHGTDGNFRSIWYKVKFADEGL